MLEKDDDYSSADIYITPPVDGQLSEEESDDDDQPQSINHLSDQQLNAEADVRLRLITTSRMIVSTTDKVEDNSQDT